MFEGPLRVSCVKSDRGRRIPNTVPTQAKPRLKQVAIKKSEKEICKKCET